MLADNEIDLHAARLSIWHTAWILDQAKGDTRVGSYGGGFEPPVSHQVAFIGFGRGHEAIDEVGAQVSLHQPRAVAWDAAHDALYIAGMGTDNVLQLKNASQMSIAPWRSVISSASFCFARASATCSSACFARVASFAS